MKYKKVIFTQLGFKFKENFNIEHSINTLINFTKYSVERQTDSTFLWCFLVGELITNKHIERIKKNINKDIELFFLKIPFSNLNNIRDNSVDYYIEKKIFDIFNSETYISIRLDSDDYMHPNLIELISSKLISEFDDSTMIICNPSLGYMYYPHINCFNKCFINNIAIGMGVISNQKGSHVINHKQHQNIKIQMENEYKNIKIKHFRLTEKPLYIYNRTNISHSFKSWENMKQKYIIKEQLEIEEIEELKKEFMIVDII